MFQAPNPYVSSAMINTPPVVSGGSGQQSFDPHHPGQAVISASHNGGGSGGGGGGGGGGPWMRYRPSLRPATTPSPALVNVTGAAGSMSHPTHHSLNSQSDHAASGSTPPEAGHHAGGAGGQPPAPAATVQGTGSSAAPPLFGIGSLGNGRSQPLAPSLTTATTSGEALTSPYSPKSRATHLAAPNPRQEVNQQLNLRASNEQITFSLHPDFSENAENCGNVRITCGGVRFWLHKE